VQRGLDELEIHHELAPRLVRGFDYYTSTTFEFVSDALDAAQNAILGGGRYDTLTEEMGGRPTPGIGFGMGIERLLIAADELGALSGSEPHPDVYVIDELAGARETLTLTQELREAGLRVERSYGNRSGSAQRKAADRARPAFVVTIAPEQFGRGEVLVRKPPEREVIEVPRDQLAGWLRDHCEFVR
jgi:histidyl-tRNA synthetase